jgi:hypothetical protein
MHESLGIQNLRICTGASQKCLLQGANLSFVTEPEGVRAVAQSPDSAAELVGGEATTTPYRLTRYFRLRAFSALYGFTWTFYAAAGAIGPVFLGRAFDATGSYASLCCSSPPPWASWPRPTSSFRAIPTDLPIN